VREDWAACRDVIARHSRSFDLAARLLPPARRDEVAALYAWCRTCDDAVDLAPPGTEAGALAALRERLAAVYGDAPLGDPLLRCFREVVRRRGIPLEYPHELLAGMEMDVAHATYESVDDLLVYCWRVAGTVGLMMCHVMGVSDDRAAPPAAHLGIAMQLTNVCRDVVEDWERGRLYLPQEILGAWGPRLREAGRGTSRPLPLPAEARGALAAAARRLLALADRYYASADAGLAWLEPRSALAVRTARLVYAEIGRRIEARGCDVLQGRAVVSGGRKLVLALRAVLGFATGRLGARAPERFAPRRVLACGDAVRLA